MKEKNLFTKMTKPLPENMYRYWLGKKRPPFSKEWRENMSKSRKGQKRPDMKGRIPWNKGIRVWSNSNEKSKEWKGEKVGYRALHRWVEKNLGRPSKCKHCETTKAKKFEWANKDGKYRRNLKDYIRLCTKCHRKYDYENKIVAKKKQPKGNRITRKQILK